MISDLNLYLSNRGLAVVDPARAMPEEKARRYLYEAVGLQPWLGSDTPTGSAKPVGEGHFLVTAKGLTKELGYVGSYGEILDWVARLYAATCDGEKPGDDRLKAQLLKLSRARAVFRYPGLREDRLPRRPGQGPAAVHGRAVPGTMTASRWESPSRPL